MKRLTIKNNWESYEYYADGAKVNPKDIQFIYDSNGNKYEVKHKKETKSYNDMGHIYYADRIVLCVKHPLGTMEIRENSQVFID